MAKLTLTVGAVTGEVTALDAQAATVLNQYADSIGAVGTNQQRAQAVVQALVRYMVSQAKAARWRVAQADATVAVQGEVDAIDWI